MLECVINVSEGRDPGTIDALAGAAARSLLDVHSDADHHRTVLTLAGPDVEADARAVATQGVLRIDLRAHVGAHPRMGAVDVVPFVPLDMTPFADALAARDRFATWAADALHVPCFFYGPERTLPEVRREAFRTLLPDVGLPRPHPTAGAICAGARPVLVAYNLWLSPPSSLEVARQIATQLRGPAVRALGLDLGGARQVSLNLLDPETFGPAEAYDAVAGHAPIERAELVGLLPSAVLERVPRQRWAQLDLDPSRTIEGRLGLRPTPPPPGGPEPAGGEAGAAPAR